MEAIATKKVRVFRSEEKIFKILDEYAKSNLSIKTFCAANNIASATFHNWKKRYSKHKGKPIKQTGFTALQITTSTPVIGPALFAEVKGIKFYQQVDAVYLKELLA